MDIESSGQKNATTRRVLAAPFQQVHETKGVDKNGSQRRTSLEFVDYRNFTFKPLAITSEVTFSEYVGPTPESNWVIPGILLVGAYPASQDDEETYDLITSILKERTSTFVCLQQEYQDEGVTEEMWRSGHALRPYFRDVKTVVRNKAMFPDLQGYDIVELDRLRFVHFPIRDCSITDDDRVLELARSLVKAISEGEIIYLHCWGGHGRTGTLVCIMLHLMYALSSVDAMSRCQLVHDLRKCPVVVGSPQTQTQRDQVTRIIHRLIVQRGLDHHNNDEVDLVTIDDNNPAVISQKKQPAAGQNRLVLSRRSTKHAVIPPGTSAVRSHNDSSSSNTPSGEAKATAGQPILSEHCYPNPIPAGLVTVFSCTTDNGSSTTTESSDEYSEVLTGGGDVGNDPFAESMDVVNVNVNGEQGGHSSRSGKSSSGSPIRTLGEGSHGTMVVTCDGLSDVIDRSPSVVAADIEERMNVVIELMPQQPQMMSPYEMLQSVTSPSATMNSAMDDTEENSSSMMVQQPVSTAILPEANSSSSGSNNMVQRQQRVDVEPPIMANYSFQTGADKGDDSLLLSAAQTNEIDNAAMEIQEEPSADVVASPVIEGDSSVRMDDGTSDDKGEDDVRQPEIVTAAAAAASSSSSGQRVVIPATSAMDRLEGVKDAAVASSSSSVNSVNSSNSKNSNTGSSSGGSRANNSKLRRIITSDPRNVVVAENASQQHQQQQQKQVQLQTRDVAAGGSPLLRPVPPTSHAGSGTASLSSSSSGPNRAALSPIRLVDKINVNITPSAMSSSAPTSSRGNSNNSSSSGVNASSVVPTPPSGHRSTHTSLRNFGGKKQLGHGNAGAARVSTGSAVTSSVVTAALLDEPDDGNA